jgi:hypothetical protein
MRNSRKPPSADQQELGLFGPISEHTHPLSGESGGLILAQREQTGLASNRSASPQPGNQGAAPQENWGPRESARGGRPALTHETAEPTPAPPPPDLPAVPDLNSENPAVAPPLPEPGTSVNGRTLSHTSRGTGQVAAPSPPRFTAASVLRLRNVLRVLRERAEPRKTTPTNASDRARPSSDSDPSLEPAGCSGPPGSLGPPCPVDPSESEGRSPHHHGGLG